MDHPFLYYFLDGTVFYAGILLVLTGGLGLACMPGRAARFILSSLIILGLILAVISATPLPLWLYLIWSGYILTALMLLNRTKTAKRSKAIISIVAGTITAALGLYEISFARIPNVIIEKEQTIYVLGDSVSAGMGNIEQCWPSIFAEITDTRVVNLAQAGAKVDEAIKQAQEINKSHALVIVEIGGNDLLSKTDANIFDHEFKQLISSLASDGHRILIFELPLFPFRNAYGITQRQTVSKYNTAMLPKRIFAGVLRTQGATLDGVHLSQKGHRLMAETIAEVIHAAN